ncbi:MAG: glycosyltransferase family 2 protein [Chloroflexi bacterium]|nr:glycosyltransferase family 2 protein [Chloroflexota bacterium]
MVLETRQYVSEVIIIDDGSSDKTAEIARLAGATVVRHDTNQGYGAAVRAALREARERRADALILLDADAQHNPAEIPAIVKPVLEDGYDLVIGSRELGHNHIPAYRRFGQKVLLFSTNLLSREKLTDSESGFRVFSKKALDELDLEEDGMAVSAETVAKAAQKGLKVTQVPISVRYGQDGSTLHPLAHGLLVLLPVISMITRKRPLFFFGAAGGIIALIGLTIGALALRKVNEGYNLPVMSSLFAALFLLTGVISIFTGIIVYVLGKREPAPAPVRFTGPPE